jgi:DNA-binding transcriptional MerR regulator
LYTVETGTFTSIDCSIFSVISFLLFQFCPCLVWPRASVVKPLFKARTIFLMTDSLPRYRIGELARRAGVTTDLLRAWERRYGLPRPSRATNGRRLYSRSDEHAVREMRRALDRGIPAAEAARLAASAEPAPAPPPIEDGGLVVIRTRLADALTRFDEAGAQEELDRLFGAYSADRALQAVVLPYLHELGDRWACNEIGVGHEHFATNLIHGRLLSLARKWDEGRGPRAVLACPSGELHTLGLLCFGLALRMHGWRITYLGADTPIAALEAAVLGSQPSVLVLAAVTPERFTAAQREIRDLARRARVVVGGAGATAALAPRLGVEVLPDDVVTAASALVP